MISHRDRRAYALYCLGRCHGAGPESYRYWREGAERCVGERGADQLSVLVGRLEREIGEG